jgi:YVTN family beta-propeller protein
MPRDFQAFRGPAALQHRSAWWLATACACLLAACGGGSGSGSSTATSATTDGRKQALTALPAGTPIPADAFRVGMWGTAATWPLVSVHAVLLPDGRVMSYGSRADGSQSGYFSVDVWDSTSSPDAGHTTIANSTGTDLFCSSQLLLPPQSLTSTPAVFMAGGDTWTGSNTTNQGNNRTSLFTATGTGALSRGADMSRNRWYSTSTTLMNGEVLVQGGKGGEDRAEVRQASGSFRVLSGADMWSTTNAYPRNFVAPDGRLFGFDGNGRMYFLDTSGVGALQILGQFDYMYAGWQGTAAMFRPGRILQVGANSNGAMVIDINGSAPVVTPTQSVSARRQWAVSTLLPDGKVLLTGGSNVDNDPTTAVRTAELWDPTSGQWTVGPQALRAGLYHSNALLLPDASVLVTTGGAAATVTVPTTDHKAQIYYPPYFFTADGRLAARPTITTTPDWLDIGKTFALQVSGTNGVSRVALVKTGSATHSFNMDQRFVELAFTRTAVAGGYTLSVQAPTRAGEATPGYYMLFVLDDAGVPSVAKILRLGVAANPNPATVPTLSKPADVNGTTGTAASLQLLASDPNGDVLRYGAAGLPPGLAVNAATGQISGTPSAPGTYNVVATASDGVNTASVNFVWTVTGAVPLTLTSVPAPSASLSGSSVALTASATGSGVEYQWSFGDGSPDSPWSASGTASKSYAAPGTYVVTLRVRDASGAFISRSFLQTIYLPATATRPSASGNLLLETPATGNARLWVVNQDANSVTAFDAVTRTKLGEVAVGAAPRTIARAPNGLLWVTNKLGASISVIDPATRTVVRTIALPRASQPFGVAMSPTAAQAFVALEAGGLLLRLDTGTYAQTASLAVGPNVRHVSVSADGANVFVSRFITPPLPGESTAVVTPSAATGGEVLRVNASTLTLAATIKLQHSDKPDTENSGAGIPNYLGAATISPDGSQAYVPGKQDNVRRGTLRSTAALNFQNTVRAISARVVLGATPAATDDLARRIDHDNASVASAVAYDARGVLLFAALETSREVAVVDAHSGRELMRFDVGRAPQGLALSADGNTLYVNNFMDRTVGVHDLRPLLQQGLASVLPVATLQAVATEPLPGDVLLGKQFFYDARDTRLARDRYMSCASCHNDGGHDGRVWDLTQSGEGLRNTISLRGRGGVAGGHGRLHWSANFDEVQDFEAQIRSLAGGTGLMPDAAFNAGTRNQPLGDPKASVSADLDRLAAYVGSLNTFDPSPVRLATGALTTDALAGRAVFAAKCASCHTGTAFSDSDKRVLHDVGTIKPGSGQRLFATLNGIDAPTLRDVWATAPYLHDGSAATLEAAVQAHGLGLSAADLASVVAFTRQIGAEETAAPASSANLVVRAMATLMDRVGALYEVRVGGQVVRKGQLDATAWVDLFIDVATLVRDTVIDVVFKNDASNATEDRNMVVQSIKVNGSATVSSSAPGVIIDAGSGAAAFDGVDTVAASSTGGWMPWNGAMRFAAPDTTPPATTETLTLRALSELAAGVGAVIELRINGQLVATREVANTTLQDLAFTVPVLRAGDRIDVVFTNDATINGQDRNLYVQAVIARGVTLLSTAADVTIDRGTGAAAFDGLDVVAASTTGGWVPWNAAIRFTAR